MRTLILGVTCLAICVPAVANEIRAPDTIWPMPKPAGTSPYEAAWRYLGEDAPLLLQLADDGDPAARIQAWWHVKDPERRKTWREAMTRANDPAIEILEEADVLERFMAGVATTEELRNAILRMPMGIGGQDVLDTLALGASIPGWHDDPFQAAPWLDTFAHDRVPGAAEAICRSTITPRNVIPDTLSYCRRLARRGDADAAYRLGLLYQRRADDFAPGLLPLLARDLGFRPDLPQALRFYRQASASGHGGAQARIAHMTAIGRGVRRDDALALRLARAAAAQDNAEGLAVLGLLTLEGRGLPGDVEAGAALIRKAAERGNRMAQYTLSTLYVRGKGVPQDWGEGLMWLHLLRLDLSNDLRGDPPPEEWGNLMIEPWPRTVAVGNYFRMAPDRYLDAQSRAAALRKRLAAEGLWPY